MLSNARIYGLPAVLLVCCLLALSNATQAQTVRAAVYENPPKVYVNQSGQPDGIFIAVLEALAASNDWQLEWQPCQWQQCLQMLENSELDLVPDVAWSEERSALFDFHQIPVLHSWSQIYQGDGPLLQSIPELHGKRLAVLQGSIQQQHLQRQALEFGTEIIFVYADSYQLAFNAVQRGEADAAAANHTFGDLQAEVMGLRPTPIMFQPSRLYFATTRGRNSGLLEQIDQQLQGWRNDPQSVYFNILRDWQPDNSTIIARIPPVTWWLGALLLGLLLLTLGFNLLLRYRVQEKTRHLHHNEQRLQTILNGVDACIFIKDTDLRYSYGNQKLCTLLGRTQDELLGCDDGQLFDDETAGRLRSIDLMVLEQGERFSQEEQVTLAKTGEQLSFLTNKLPLHDPQGNTYAICGISSDISDLRKMQHKAHQLSFYDPLTALPNRRLLIDRLSHALASHARSGLEGVLIVIDIDNFKMVNDTRGLAFGDELLCQVADRLTAQLRAADTVARLGADEFAILLENLNASPDANLQHMQRIAAQLLDSLAVPYSLRDGRCICSASMGLVMLSEGDGTAEELLKRADLAMVDAKNHERGGIRFFNPDMQAEANRRAALETALRQAIQTQQLQLYLQPQVNAQGDICSMEVLLRWKHPDEGFISPAEFIPLAENSGLILPLGNWVLQQACRQLAEWSHGHPLGHIRLAVNISSRQFRHAQFVETLLQCLHDHGVEAARLELEITESLLIDDLDNTIRRLRELRQHGISVSLDDFGTGYASLSYLKRLPLDQVKIDQSFVRDLLDDPSDEAIVRSIIALGGSMELSVIAEGVETVAQHERLLALGCSLFQGYLFGRPAPAEYWLQQVQARQPALARTRPEA